MNNLLLFTLDYIEGDEYGYDICCESYGYIIEATSITMAIMQFYAATENYHIIMIREILKTSLEYGKVIGKIR